jgi:hypothetical protein
MTDLKARIIRPALVAGALLAGSLALATPAFASPASPASPAARHNECRSWEEELISWPLEPRHRVLAECSYINPAEKARGVLDLVGQGDAHTDWFTQTGVIYESSWRTPLFGVRGTRMEYEPRLRRAGNLAGRSRSRTRARDRPRAAAN